MHKLVLDTNIVVSACISEHSPPGKIIDRLFMEDKIEICLSVDVVEEYAEVLNREKFLSKKGFSLNAQKFLQYVAEFGLWFEPIVSFTESRDADDNIFLDLAFAASADFIITGNLKDFPTPDFQGIRVVSPADYWNFFREHLLHEQMLTFEKILLRFPHFSDAEVADIFQLTAERVAAIRKGMTEREQQSN